MKSFALKFLGVTVSYFAAAQLGLLFLPAHGPPTLLWPPAGVALLGALLLWGPGMARPWPWDRSWPQWPTSFPGPRAS